MKSSPVERSMENKTEKDVHALGADVKVIISKIDRLSADINELRAIASKVSKMEGAMSEIAKTQELLAQLVNGIQQETQDLRATVIKLDERYNLVSDIRSVVSDLQKNQSANAPYVDLVKRFVVVTGAGAIGAGLMALIKGGGA